MMRILPLLFYIAFGAMAALGGVLVLTSAAAPPLLAARLFNAVATEGGVIVTRDIAYGPHERHRLDTYVPAKGGERGPVALFLYGGGWREGDRSLYGFVGEALASRGIATVIADYRLFPEVKFPDPIKDAALAYRWLSTEIADKGGAARPIVVIGHSAGAHIGALLTYDPSYLATLDPALPRPSAFVGLAGPYSFDPTTWPTTKDIFAGIPEPDKTRPITFVAEGAPPALLMHGLDDDVVRMWNLRQMAARLESVGTHVETAEIKGIGHAGIVLALAWPLRWRAPVLSRITGFISRYARPAAAGRAVGP